MISGRNKIVSCTLRRGTGQDRSRDLQKSVLHHAAAQLCDNVAAKNDFLLDCRVAQIQITVFQTCIFVCFLGTVDLKRKLIVDTFAEYGNLCRHNLDLAGRQIRVFAGALTDYTGNGDCGFRIDTGNLLHHFLGLDDDLCGSVEITQNQKAEILAYSS